METIHKSGTGLTVKSGDINVCYDDNGEGTIPIIFLHGFPFDRTMWQPQLNFLSKSNRVIAYDIRGYGKSEVGSEKSSISLFTKDLIAFMDALQIDKAIVCGLSMGGYIVLKALTTNPERFKAVILADTQCVADTEEGKAGRMKAIGQIKEKGLEEFAEGFIKKIFWSETLVNNKELVENIKQVILKTNHDTVTGTLSALAEREETCSTLENIKIPVLILCGENDQVTPPEKSRAMHDKIKGSVLYSISNAGHMSSLEQPDFFNNYVSLFVDEIK